MSAARTGSLRLLAPAKINPTLVVVERRGDGFHELDLSFLALDLADVIELRALAYWPEELRLSGPMATADVPIGSENLARRGAAAVLDIACRRGLERVPGGFDIALSKNVPSQAGLGGGSSDATAAALAACMLCRIPPDDPAVLAALAALGADCAFFLAARGTGHARGRGRGELLEALPMPRVLPWIALIAPRVGASTAAVYLRLGELGHARENRARGERAIGAWRAANTIEELRGAACNDLESAALRAVPELATWRELLDRRGAAHFQLAGSGSCFFGLFAGADEAQSTLDELKHAADSRGLGSRGSWIARPAGHGARALE